MPRNESPGDFLVPEVAHRTHEKTFVSHATPKPRVTGNHLLAWIRIVII